MLAWSSAIAVQRKGARNHQLLLEFDAKWLAMGTIPSINNFSSINSLLPYQSVISSF